MAKSAIHLLAHHDGLSIDASAEAFLLGPKGQLWGLDPSAELRPRLWAASDQGQVVLSGAPQPGGSAYLSIGHRARYLTVRCVRRQGDALADAGRVAQLKGGTVKLLPRTLGVQAGGTLKLVNANSNGAGDTLLLALLKDGSHWTSTDGNEGSHLLIHPEATSAWELLRFAQAAELPQSFSGHAPWERALKPGHRGRLSPLAARAAA